MRSNDSNAFYTRNRQAGFGINGMWIFFHQSQHTFHNCRMWLLPCHWYSYRERQTGIIRTGNTDRPWFSVGLRSPCHEITWSIYDAAFNSIFLKHRFCHICCIPLPIPPKPMRIPFSLKNGAGLFIKHNIPVVDKFNHWFSCCFIGKWSHILSKIPQALINGTVA